MKCPKAFYNRFHFLMCSVQHLILESRLAKYAEVIADAGRALVLRVKFIDVTNIHNVRPKEPMQRATYSGHKQQNVLKMQVITVSDKLVFKMSDSIEANRHDITLFRSTGTKHDLVSGLAIGNIQLCLYDNLAFGLRPFLMIRLSNSVLLQIRDCLTSRAYVPELRQNRGLKKS